MSDSREHRTVFRVATILEAVAAAGADGLTLLRIVEFLDAPKSSVHDLVRGLEAVGYLANDAGSYRIGPAPEAFLNRRPAAMLRVARPQMEHLHARFNETVCLSELVGETSVYRLLLESTHPIRYSSALGRRNPLYPMSAGKVFLASMQPRRQQAYVRGRLAENDQDRVLRELVEIRSRGCSFNHEESLEGLSAIACLVGEVDGSKWALSIAGPSHRMNPMFGDMEMALMQVVPHLILQVEGGRSPAGGRSTVSGS
ncbi:MAG TPA: IclR family transcriptional regulator C-terminal domain-containing protein [Pseudonocardia sp.]